MKKRWHLYVITSEELSKGRSTLEVVEKAVDGGADVIQLREKGQSGRELVKLGQKIKEITVQCGVTFIVNDRIDVAMAVDADGVHLGQEDIPLAYARKILGKDKIIGISASTLEEALEAEMGGADYVGVGPIYETASKDDAGRAIGLQELARIRRHLSIPIVAIGGITFNNAGQVIENGADCISVISAVTTANDIAGAARRLKSIILQAKGLR